uniref:Putative RGD-containing peptide n=1 Tax=Lutzomyia longipalpis TaxID=7200 RepID=Q9XZ49_LUTLO|nr:putative RGD-containing peptide [Lutzomyia longipalpis]
MKLFCLIFVVFVALEVCIETVKAMEATEEISVKLQDDANEPDDSLDLDEGLPDAFDEDYNNQAEYKPNPRGDYRRR